IGVTGVQSVERSLSHLAKTRENAKNRVPVLSSPSPRMPPQRSTLGPISGNRVPNCELTPYTRGKIIGLSLKGAKLMEIQDHLKITRGALHSTLSLDCLRNEDVSQPRTGHPKVYTE